MKHIICTLLLLITGRWIGAQTNSTISLQQKIQNKEAAVFNSVLLPLNKTTNVNSLPEQDCSAAIIVCQPTFSVANSYVGIGNLSDNIQNSCLTSGERNSVWYTLTTNTVGNIEFLITPNNLVDDYDFALYDITNQNCNDINSGILLPIRCSFSATGGVTGLSSLGTNTSEPASGSNYNTILSSQAGRTYVLVLSNYSSSSFGYTLDFSASTAGIFTGTASVLQQVTTYCGIDSLILNLSRPVINTSIAADGSDFSLSGPGGPYSVISAQGLSSLNSSQVKIKFNSALSGSGPWNLGVLVGSDNNTLVESCSSQSTAISSITFSAQPLTTILSPTSICKGVSFTLTASPAITYSWSGSLVPGSQANQQSISVNTNSVGVFSFSVQSNGACGMTSSTKTVSVLDFPTADFSILSANPICVGTAVSFTNMSVFPCSIGGNGSNVCNCGAFLCNPTSNQNGFASYVWDYGDTTALVLGYNPTHTYTNSGSYTIQLRASNLTVNAGCVSLKTLAVTVLSSPVLVATSGTICSGNSYISSAVGANTYTWSTGANTQSIVVSPTVNTSYTVTGSNGCGLNSQTVTVSVSPSPTVLVNSGTLCAGESFTLNPTGAISYTYSSVSPIVTPIVSSTYTILGYDLNGCSGSAISSLSVNTLPSLTMSATSTICAGTSSSIFVVGANTYTWSTGANTSTINVMPTTTTIYSVTGSDLNNCSNTQTIGITIDPTCQDVWPGDANSDGVADNLDVLELGLHYTQTGAPRASTSNAWQSYFANNWTGTITNGKNLNHSDCNGDGTIDDNDTLAIYNNYGLTHTFKPAQTNTVNPQLSIIPDQTSVVKGTWGTASIYLGDATTNINSINGVAFTVDFDNSLIETNNIYIEYQNSFLDAGQNLDFRNLDFTNSKLFTATTHTINNNVSGNGLIAKLHYQIKSSLTTDEVLNIGLSLANQSAASGLITPLTSGTGTLMALGTSVGLQELNGGLISISPNPTNGSLIINSKTELQKIEVVSITGQILLSETPANVSHTLQLENFANGIYFVNLYQSNRIVKREKIVLNK